MARDDRFPTLGETLGYNQDGTPQGDVFQIYLDLDVRDEEELRKLPEHAQNIWFIYRYDQEVVNGGTDQFICNSSGKYITQTLHALEAIGARQQVEWLRHACELFPNGVPDVDQDARRGQYDAIIAAHSTNANRVKLDDLVAIALPGSLVDEEDLMSLALAYWKSHT